MSAQVSLFSDRPLRLRYSEQKDGARHVRVLTVDYGETVVFLHARTNEQAAQFRAVADALKEPAQ